MQAKGVLSRAAVRGVSHVIVPSYDVESWASIAALASDHTNVHPAYGLHPWAAHTTTPEALHKSLEAQLTTHPDTVAIGEIGLDTKLTAEDAPTLATQLPILRTQLDLATAHDLPVILHCRGAFEDLLAEIHRHKGALRGVLHAYSRGPELAQRFIDAGMALGLGGAITRPKARVRRTAARIPLEHFVLETDAPSIGLEGVPPEQTEPAHVADIAQALADLRGEPLTTIAEVTTAHAQRLFRLPA